MVTDNLDFIAGFQSDERGLVGNVKMGHKEVRWKGVDWIHLTWGRD
jgi:hypothetical protein